MLIATALTTLILSVLLAAYFQAESASREAEKMRQELWPEKMLEQRLLKIFYQLSTPDQKNKPFIGTSQNLLATYQNGVSLDSIFSGLVLSYLSIDPDGNLSLLTWPALKKWKEGEFPRYRYEALLANVESLQLDYYDLKDWKTSWPQENKELPAMIKVTIKRKDKKDLVLSFPVPKTIGVIER